MSVRATRSRRVSSVAIQVAESLEKRQLLSFTPEQEKLINTWEHLSSAARTDLAMRGAAR